MSLSQHFLVTTFKAITSLICRIDDAALKSIPQHGPLIIYTNHVNVLEIPIIYTHLQPRRVHGMVYAERWKSPTLRWMLDATGTIPLHRGEADIHAVRRGLEALSRGEMVIISPEGTRSHDGRLQPAHPGVVLLALHSHAALVPVAYYGAEHFKENLRRLKRTNFHLGVGEPFHLDARGDRVSSLVRQKMMDEMMYRLARLLPPEYRGVYANIFAATQDYLVFD